MRSNKENKEKLIDEIKKMPKEANRMLFVNKINDIHNKLQKSKEDLIKSEDDIKKASCQISKVKGVLERSTVAIQNVLNLATKDSILLRIRDEYKMLQKDYKVCMKYYVDGGQTQLETRSLSIKNDLLKQKRYKETIEKISSDLQSLKQENEELLMQKSPEIAE